jgi:hypothetical protein
VRALRLATSFPEEPSWHGRRRSHPTQHAPSQPPSNAAATDAQRTSTRENTAPHRNGPKRRAPPPVCEILAQVFRPARPSPCVKRVCHTALSQASMLMRAAYAARILRRLASENCARRARHASLRGVGWEGGGGLEEVEAGPRACAGARSTERTRSSPGGAHLWRRSHSAPGASRRCASPSTNCTSCIALHTLASSAGLVAAKTRRSSLRSHTIRSHTIPYAEAGGVYDQYQYSHLSGRRPRPRARPRRGNGRSHWAPRMHLPTHPPTTKKPTAAKPHPRCWLRKLTWAGPAAKRSAHRSDAIDVGVAASKPSTNASSVFARSYGARARLPKHLHACPIEPL